MDIGRLFEETTESDDRYIIHQGGTRCFHPDTKVITSKGLVKIKDIKEGDLCLSNAKGCKCYKKVLNTFKLKNSKPTVKIKFKNGKEIIATDDHKFFYEGGWQEIKSILSNIN